MRNRTMVSVPTNAHPSHVRFFNGNVQNGVDCFRTQNSLEITFTIRYGRDPKTVNI